MKVFIRLFDLNYLDPTDADAFARYLVTGFFKTDGADWERPLVVIYAAPAALAEVRLTQLLRRRQDPGLKLGRET